MDQRFADFDQHSDHYRWHIFLATAPRKTQSIGQ